MTGDHLDEADATEEGKLQHSSNQEWKGLTEAMETS